MYVHLGKISSIVCISLNFEPFPIADLLDRNIKNIKELSLKNYICFVSGVVYTKSLTDCNKTNIKN